MHMAYSSEVELSSGAMDFIVQCSFPESDAGHSKALSVDGRFDPVNI